MEIKTEWQLHNEPDLSLKIILQFIINSTYKTLQHGIPEYPDVCKIPAVKLVCDILERYRIFIVVDNFR